MEARLSLTAGGKSNQAGAGAAVLAHADFVDGFGRIIWIQQFQQFEQCAATVGSCAIRDLPHHDVLVEAIQLRSCARQKFEQHADIQAVLRSPTVEAACRG